MSNRTLARHTDAVPEILEDGEPHHVGMWEAVTIERSAAGAPGIFIIITRYENDQEYDQMSVYVKDAVNFLAPVNAWLAGCDPQPWVSRIQGERYPTPDAAPEFIGTHGFDFHPRPGYLQNREDYPA